MSSRGIHRDYLARKKWLENARLACGRVVLRAIRSAGEFADVNERDVKRDEGESESDRQTGRQKSAEYDSDCVRNN